MTRPDARARRRPARARRLAGAAVTLAAVVALILVAGGLGSGQDTRTLHLAVESTGDLRPGDAVRVSGVKVGSVASVDLDEDARGAGVRLEIDRSVDVRADARAALRWRTLLGGAMVVDLDPGTRRARPLGDVPIPRARTSVQVELDDIASIVARPTKQSLHTLLEQGAVGLRDGDVVGSLLRSAPRRLDAVAAGVAPVNGRRADDLTATVTAASRVVAALDRGGRSLGRLLDGAGATLSTTAARRSELGRTFTAAPAGLARTDALLRRVRTTLRTVDPVADDLRPGLRAVSAKLPAARRTLAAVTRTAGRARPLLGALPATAAELAGAARETRTVVDRLRPVLDATDDELLPWLQERDPRSKLRTYEAIGPTFAVAIHPEFDAGGFFLPFPADFGDSGAQDLASATSGCLALLPSPSASERRRCATLAKVFDGRLRIERGGR